MRLIKRYPNRKLYDTEARAYISLEQVARLVQDGVEVQVVDHATGGDLTALTLAQIIVEQAKQERISLPRAALTALVQAGGDALASVRRGPTVARDLARQVDDEIGRRIQSLVQMGDLAEEDGLRLRDRLLAAGDRLAGGGWPRAQAALQRVLARQDVLDRAEIAALGAQLAALEAEVAALCARRRAEPPAQ